MKLRCLLSALLCLATIARSQVVINPADYGTITLHLKADALALTNNASVTSWGSLGATGSATPTYIASDTRFGNKPVVKFDGADDVLSWTGANLAAQTIFVVTSFENSSTSLATLISTGADFLNIRRNGTALFYRSLGQGADGNEFIAPSAAPAFLSVNNVVSGGFTATVPHILCATAASPKTYGNFWLGTSGNSLPRFWNGSVAEVIVYNGALTTTGINRVGWYLQNKYGLAGGYPSPAPAIQRFTASTAGGLVSDAGVLSTSGAPVTLTWNSPEATSISIDNGAQSSTPAASGNVIVSPAATTTYTLTASNGLATSTKSVTIYIGVTPQSPRINEFLAQNDKGLLDEDLAPSDWIEIYNPNPFAMDLAGYRLKDSAAQWDFPVGSTIAAVGYKVIFASGKNRVNPAANLHTNFALSASGEYLGLIRISDSAVMSEFAPAFPAQATDRSYGYWNSPIQLGYFGKPIGAPTPGAANGPVGVTAFLDDTDDTKFLVGRGFYTTAVSEVVTCLTPGARLIYTTNGSEPTATNGTVVLPPNASTPPTASIQIHPSAIPGGATGLNVASIGGVTTLRIAAFKDGFAPTNTDTQTYVFSQQVLGQTVADATAKGWPSASVNGQVFNYGMDPNVIASFTNQDMLTSLQSMPSVSLVTDMANLVSPTTGIYVNADQQGGAWERPASMELIFPPGYVDPDGNAKGFQINAGLRIRGGASRGDGFYKHALRLFFDNDYDGDLNYKLFGNEGADSFEKLDLATGSNYAWYREASFANGKQNTMCRDMFCRDTQGAMGQPYAKSRFYHLYINGHYWGVYYSEERPEAEFAASYEGGSASDYDCVKCANHSGNFTTEATDGTLAAWQTLWTKVRAIATSDASDARYYEILGRNPDGTRNPALPVLLDVDNLIDEMIEIFYAGDGDAVLSNFLGHNMPNNWFSTYNRNGQTGFRFYVHDAEHTLGAGAWVVDQTGPWGGSNKTNFLYSNPQWLHEDLLSSPRYKERFADHVQKHFFNGGALTPAVAAARLQKRADQVALAIKAESARWGDAQTITGLPAGHPARYELADWQAEIANIKNNILPNRTATVLAQLTADGLYPTLAASTFVNAATSAPQHGGDVPVGFSLQLTAPAGSIYYTLDGSDPRVGSASQPFSSTFVSHGATVKWQVPANAAEGFSIAPPVSVTPIAYYPLDSTVNDAAAATGTSNGTIVGAPTFVAGRVGAGGLQLSGTGQAVTLGDPTELQITGQITISAWVKPNAVDGLRDIVAKGYGGTPTQEGFLRINGGNYEIGSYDGNNHLTSTPAAVDGQWVHLAGMWDGTAWKLYKNGVLASSTIDAIGALPVTGQAWAIGARGTGTERFFNGVVDDVAIFNTALTAAQVAELYKAGTYQPAWAATTYAPAASWTAGTTGIGFDTDAANLYGPYLGTNIAAAMATLNPGCLIRHEFNATPAQLATLQSIGLKIRYDDGFVAYLNGTEILRRNAPAIIDGAAAASQAHADAAAVLQDGIDVTTALPLLQNGANVLAIHGLNVSATDDDFLVDAEFGGSTTPPGVSGSAILYTGPITLSSTVTINARVYLNGVWSALDAATFTVNTIPAAGNNLVVSQISYNPVSGNTKEFLELMNISTSNVDLTGVKIREGVDYDFQANTFLAPGGRIQIVGDLAGFAGSYSGAGLKIVGPYAGNLSNGGERLHIFRVNTDNSVVEIKDFSYDDEFPWPAEADGLGYGLVLVNPMANPDHALATNWRGSALQTLAPGASDKASLTGNPLDDLDQDGISSLVEYALGTSDNDSGSGIPSMNVATQPFTVGNVAADYFTLTFNKRANADDAETVVEISDNLGVWHSGPDWVVMTSQQRTNDSTVTQTWRSARPYVSTSREFMRLNVKLR